MVTKNGGKGDHPQQGRNRILRQRVQGVGGGSDNADTGQEEWGWGVTNKMLTLESEKLEKSGLRA